MGQGGVLIAQPQYHIHPSHGFLKDIFSIDAYVFTTDKHLVLSSLLNPN